MDPAMRQNFAYAFAETHNLNLEVRHTLLSQTIIIRSSKFLKGGQESGHIELYDYDDDNES